MTNYYYTYNISICRRNAFIGRKAARCDIRLQ